MFHAFQVVVSRSQKSTETILEEQACGVGKALIEAVYELGVEEHVATTAGHIIDALREVHLGLTLLHTRGGHVIVLVAEKVIRDKAAEQSVNDKRPSHPKASRVVGIGMDEVGLRRRRGAGEKESDFQRCQAFTESLTVEVLRHC